MALWNPYDDPPEVRATNSEGRVRELTIKYSALTEENAVLIARVEQLERALALVQADRKGLVQDRAEIRRELKYTKQNHQKLLNQQVRKSSKPPGSTFGSFPVQPPKTAHEAADPKKRKNRRGAYGK